MPEPTNTPSPSSSPTPGSPPPEANPSADKVFTLGDLGISMDDGQTPPVPPSEPTPPPTDEPGKDDNDAPPDNNEPTGDLDGKDKNKPASENTVQFDKDDEPFLKKMHKDASTHFGKKIAGLKAQLTTAQQSATELQSKLDAADGKKLPDTWYEHEQAYQLSPQYQEINTKFSEAQNATHFWTEQLERCKANASLREGEPFIPYYLPGHDGKLVPVSEEQYTAKHEVPLNDLRMTNYDIQKKLSADAEKLQKDFTESHKQTDSQVRAVTRQKFSFVEDKKHAFHNAYQEVLKKVPSVHKNNPFAELTAALAVQVIYEQHLRAEIEKKMKAANGVHSDQKQAGPIPGRAATQKSAAADRHYKPEELTGL